MPRWARYDIWNVGIARLDAPLTDVHQLRHLSSVRWLPPQGQLHYVADPFPYRDAHGHEWLLVEDYGHQKGVRGHISQIDPADPSRPVPAIIRERHISYPYIFTDDRDTWCAPEMSAEDGCVLYRLDADGRWNAVHHILTGIRVVDPTFFRYGDRWWLFCTEPPPQHNSILHAFYADRIEGPWTPHARNPIKQDIASARPAGRLFAIGDRIYRPAQDCSHTYGGAVNVMEITRLTPTDFSETLTLRLEPEASWPYPDGLHHLVVDGTRVYLDAKRTHIDLLLPLKL